MEGLGVERTATPTEDSKYVIEGFDPDSFGSVLSRTFNESYIGGLDFLGVIGRKLGSQDLVDLSESQIKETKKDIKALGTPTRDVSFTKSLEDIDKIYEEE